MQQLVFATQNEHKVLEINRLLADIDGLDTYEVLSLSACGIDEDIPETAGTIEGNARQKASFIHKKYGFNCFSEDTGLEVEALNQAPGIFSARYAGPQKRSEDNIKKLLKELSGQENRRARFRTVICLILDKREHIFEGIIKGKISETPAGESGFGYDPVFIPEGFLSSFAQMDLTQKNQISHRSVAFSKMIDFLRSQK
ncbi:MAG TPA: non-canonical purine NTP pyrophosphatase, RdgB/HAM1 family [Saprospirales bacterium]|nr:non-canonical purine NTP pyrophosphatase, RdgB/HAM1 family [Saprospirales bacterium]